MPYDNKKRKFWKAAGYRSTLGSAAVDLPPPQKYLRVYHLVEACYAITNLQHGRLKIGRFADLNDPFELLSVSVMDADLRTAVHAYKKAQHEATGIVSFSEDWTSPVMWSHYAKNHTGICLGFNVRRDDLEKVDYKDKRLRSELASRDVNGVVAAETLPEDLRASLRITKASEWKYEQEQRLFVPLDKAVVNGALLFRPFDASVELAEVILGPRCEEKLEDVRKIVAGKYPQALVYAARLAWKHFKVVPKESTVP